MEEEEKHKWCPKQESLLNSWAERAAGYRWLHNHARLHFKKQNEQSLLENVEWLRNYMGWKNSTLLL